MGSRGHLRGGGRLLLVLALLVGMLSLPARAQQAVGLAPSANGPGARPRLIQIKVDGLSPFLLDALIDPDDPQKLARLPDPEGFHRAIALFRQQTGQVDLVPNIRHYFYQQGVRAERMLSATVTLSAIAWGVIDTGQPSVVKRHMAFSRQTGYLRSHMDGFRDTLEFVLRKSRKTNALWQLDQAGVSLFSDAFNPLRRYEIPQIYYRVTPRDYLLGLGTNYVFAGQSPRNPLKVLQAHLARRAEGIDYVDFGIDFATVLVAKKILEPDLVAGERYDYVSTFFTIDHQQHVDPNPENLVRRMVQLDRRIGRILRAVERSQRRDSTLVVLVSDHGSEYQPGAINLAWPITRVFRTRRFGGHTVATVMAEDAGRALTNPIPAVDFPRVYESPYSPYGAAAESEGHRNYVTAVIDNFGNARAELHLRNNDLNRLHLLLQARHRQLDEEGRARLREHLRLTLAAIREWLEPELADYLAYYQGVRDWLPQLEHRSDPYWRDAAIRLREENQRDAAQLRVLQRLAELCRADQPLLWLKDHQPTIPQLIPKKYFGPRNSLYQLTHYTVGLDESFNWVETTLDRQGRPRPMNYLEILSTYEAPNPPLSHEPNPTDLIVRSLGVEPLRAALVARGWLEPTVRLRRIVWVVSTARHNLRRGDQALVLEATDGRVRYLPLRNLEEDAEGRFTFQPHNELDPLGLFYDPKFHSPTGEPAFLWLERFHTRQEWQEAAYDTRYTIAPLVFLEIAGVHTDRFLNNPAFLRALAGFPSEEAKQGYLRGLHWKYAAQQPDLLLWSNYLWNYSSKSHTSGGSHGGLSPLVARTVFLLWGGRGFALPRGGVMPQAATTLDIVPTVAYLLGMLDPEGQVIPQAGAVRERPFLPLPGRVLLPVEPLEWAGSLGPLWPPGRRSPPPPTPTD
ncbi:MAG: alkaline phosphatase family protein [Terriglobia bacterium]